MGGVIELLVEGAGLRKEALSVLFKIDWIIDHREARLISVNISRLG